MNAAAEYRVGSADRFNARHAVAEDVRRFAAQVADDARARTPVHLGTLRAAWHVERGDTDPATAFVVNDARNAKGTMYAVPVEYGTSRRPAHPVLGPVAAAWATRPGWYQQKAGGGA